MKIIICLFICSLSLTQAITVKVDNAHHHSIRHWLKKQMKDKNLKGSPILHFDSHTDMGFIPSHYKLNGQYKDSKEILNELTTNSIKAFQSSLTHISQVLVPVVSIGLSNEVHMCAPPWFTRVNIYNKKVPFSTKTLNKAQFVNSPTHRVYPVTSIQNTFKASPFFHDNQKEYKSASITFYKCFDSPKLNIKKDYILSLDLDILSTNGQEHDHVKPISFYRSSSLTISKKEIEVFNKRIQKIKDIILKLKKDGVIPKIVTIAQSTGDIGGNYTPNKLAIIATKEFKEFFNLHFSQEPLH